MVSEFKNKSFEIADLGPGEAEDWNLDAFLQRPGWAKFRTYGGFVLSERFDWFDSYAKVWSGVEPFDLTSEEVVLTIPVVSVALDYFEVSGDIRRILPVTSSFQVVGTVPGQTNLDAYWTVLSLEFDGTVTKIYVTEDILADVPANIIIPPIVNMNIDNYGWGARVDSLATYPVAPLSGGETLDISINRNIPIVVTFAGGETTAQNVVDLLNAEFVSQSVEDEIVAVVENTVPVIKTLAQSTGQYLQVTGGTADAVLLFADFEQHGFGQFAQLFSIYFEDPSNATAEELDYIFKQYVQHAYFKSQESQAGGNVMVRSERAGDLASCQVWGYDGDVMSNASWPIAPRTTLNNTLNITINNISFSATLTVGATTAEELQEDIKLSISSNNAPGTVVVAGNGQLVIGGSWFAQITGGTANSDLNFPTHKVWGNNRLHGVLGFSSEISVGAYDVGFADNFDSVNSIAANFAGVTSTETTSESFEWTNVIDDLDETTIIASRFKSWAEWANRGEITSVNIGEDSFTISGDKTEFFYSGGQALVQNSTANDGSYTVVSSEYAFGSTKIYVSENVSDSTADGEIFPMVFGNITEDFDQARGDSFLSNANDPPKRFWGGVLVGDPLNFPLDIPANRNEMWIYVGSEENLVRIVVDADKYNTASELVLNMNSKFSAASGADLEFVVKEENESKTEAKVGFGWNGVGSSQEEFFFANQHGTFEGLDIRETIGMIGISGTEINRIVVPSRYFSKVEGQTRGTVPDAWESDPSRFDVDPDSRFSYTIQTTPAGETVVVPEGQYFSLFNQLSMVDDSANEQFQAEGWGGAILDEPAFEATLEVAWFNQNLTPTDFEGFEEGW